MYNRVEYPQINYNSVLGVLPPLKSQPDPAALQDEAIMNALTVIRRYLGIVNHCNATGQESCMMSGGGEGKSEFHPYPPKLPDLTKEQAFKVIFQLNAEYNFMGVLHLPKLNAIMFQTNDDSHAIQYGSPATFHPLYINLNHIIGFTTSNSGFQKDVAHQLQKFFLKWNLHLRTGHIIPEDAQGCELASGMQDNYRLFANTYVQESAAFKQDSGHELRK